MRKGRHEGTGVGCHMFKSSGNLRQYCVGRNRWFEIPEDEEDNGRSLDRRKNAGKGKGEEWRENNKKQRK